MGDVYINLLRYETCKFAQSLLLSLQSVNVIPTSDKPTRVHTKTATHIDNVFVNTSQDDLVSGNIISDFSEHHNSVFITRENLSHPGNIPETENLESMITQTFRTLMF